MSSAVIEPFVDVAGWAARRANGTASTAMSISLDGPARLPALGEVAAAPTATMTASTAALGNRMALTRPAIDLSALDDLVMWVRGDRRADGTESGTFFAQVQLGSATLAAGAAGNNWVRFIPVFNPGTWEYVPMSLHDLPATVRSAVTELRITSTDGVTGWQLHVDSILAVRNEVLTDTDAALHDLLHRQIRVGNTALDAVFVPTTTPPAPPYLRILNSGLRPRPAAAGDATRTDYAGVGFTLRRPSIPAEFTYLIDVVTDERSIAAQATSELLETLLGRNVLVVAGKPCRFELIDLASTPLPPVTELPSPAPAVPAIQVQVNSSITRPGPRESAVPPFNAINLEVDHASP